MISFHREHRIVATGAGSGIGKAVALACNALGATVIANGRDLGKLEDAGRKCAHPEAFHVEALDLQADVDALPQWIKSLRERYGKLGGLVCCAGHAGIAPLREYSRVEAGRLFDIHFHVPLLLSKGFADRRNNIGPGSSIVFLSSAAAVAREAGLAAYGGAKAALLTASGVLSKELAPLQIRVNAIAPGVVRTPMGEAYLSFLSDEAREKEMAAYPFGVGAPDDVAGMVAFLLSDAGKWITGQTIVMDGGRY
ncbi:MAG: SDR family oxidoreductase [Deltaproteobacteria bacterium]|jgi:NAD(P)-dependent dehydrogenase (short-subunit alcohol dehydrogenase family)|nr:SDR family oxidoreductase [Deltaproteobacteria bacterium]